MPLLSSALLLLSLLACGDKDGDDTGGGDGGGTDGGGDGGADGGTGDGGTAGDGGTGDGGTGDGGTGDGGTGDGGTGDGGTGDGGSGDGGSGDGGAEPITAYTDLSWRLHADVESLVYVSWTQDGPGTVHVAYSFDEGEWHQSPSFEAEAGSHEQILVGIPYGLEVDWKIVDEGTGVETGGEAAITGRLPRGLPEASLEVSEPKRWLPEGRFLLTSVNEETGGWTGGHYWTVILDRQGRPVWASEAPSGNWTLFAQVSVTGDYFLWDEATYWSDWDEGAGSTVHRTWLDAEMDEIATPGLHHAIVQLPDETLAWGSQDHGGGEALVEQPIGATEQTILWTVSGDWPGAGSSAESNGLFYSPDRDTYLYSFYTNNSVVEVDRETGESLWWAGDVRNGYSFAEDSLRFSWQHGISWTDAGTLLLSSSNYAGGRSYTPVIEYEVDFETETLTEVWSYDPGVHADTNGDAWRLSNGNTLHVIGSSGHIMEVDPEGEPVWHLDYGGTHLLGRGELIDDLYALVSPDARR